MRYAVELPVAFDHSHATDDGRGEGTTTDTVLTDTVTDTRTA